ncbi:hypothetical protein IFM89_037404 [Coptis chinensis]|uniref:SWIM-type domain-containing protein n=1 Tax=Coptis chinensis TaxID=261450 RepID=A0A835IJH3_9MAGN|nr:hypothetical protein IFM89_037404 [Coptis chinensis]
MELLEGDVVPNVLFMIKKREMRYNWYEVRVVSDTEYLVVNTKKGSRYSVDLVKLECTCIEWQLSGVPCVRGIAVIRQRRGDKWARYCSPYFSVEAFRQTYSNYLYPLDNIAKWPEIEDPEEGRATQQQQEQVQEQAAAPVQRGRRGSRGKARGGRAAQQQQELVQEQVAAPVQRGRGRAKTRGGIGARTRGERGARTRGERGVRGGGETPSTPPRNASTSASAQEPLSQTQ